MSPASVLALLALTACSEPQALPVPRVLVAEEVHLVGCAVGRTCEAQVRLTNAGAGRAWLTTEVGDPFRLIESVLPAQPGAVVTLHLEWRPESHGRAAAALTIRTEREELSVRVIGDTDPDADADGHDDARAGGDDCDDLDPEVHPGADEICDGVDQDCDGAADDDATDAPIWYPDADGDGFGVDAQPFRACDAPEGYSLLGGDCDDDDDAVRPGAAEIWYDGVDQDCSGGSDHDRDGDGYELAWDCDDTDASVHPGAAERWYDGVDQDCSGGSDHDRDGDGRDHPADCDDLDAAVAPGLVEVSDDRDQDCDGLIDEHLLAPGDLVFTELLLVPAATDPADGQLVEILNASDRTVHLDGMKIASRSSSVVLGSLSLDPGAALVLCHAGAPGDYGCGALLPELLGLDGTLSLIAESRLDRVAWSGWVIPTGASLELVEIDPILNDDPGAWCVATEPIGGVEGADLGTPGDGAPSCG